MSRLPAAMRYDEPALVHWDGRGNPELRLRVLRAVAAGVRRASTTMAKTGSTRADEPALAPTGWGLNAVLGMWTLPSYDQGGTPVRVPVLSAPGGDRLVPEAFQDLRLIRVDLEEFHSGGSSYVETPSLARAIGWGRVLYGGVGFAIVERIGDHPHDRFVVVPLDRPLVSAKLGKGPQVRHPDPDVPATVHLLKRGEFLPLADFLVVTAHTADGQRLFWSAPGWPWGPREVDREYRRTPPAELLTPADAVRAATTVLTAAPGADAQDALLRQIVSMDRTVFGLMPWQQRAGYLTTLAGLSWPSEREQKATVELVASARTRTELEAIFAILRERGAYSRLFAKLDGTIIELLVILGESRPAAPMSVDYLIALFREQGLMLMPGVRNAIDGLATWVRSTVAGLKDLFEHSPAELAEGVAHLAEFVGILYRAHANPPDPQALTILEQIVEHAGKTIRKAIAGLEYAEQLGTAYGHRGSGAQITGNILDLLKTALSVEVLSWFVGIGELKEAIAAAEIPARVASLITVLATVRGLGTASKAAEIAEIAEIATKLDRFFTVLVRVALLKDQAAAARAVRLLPPVHLAEIGRLAELLDVPQGSTPRAFRALAKAKGVGPDVQRLADALSLARRLERKAGAAAGAEEMAAALRRLLETGWDRTRLASLIDAVPRARLSEWCRALTVLRPEQVEWLGARGLEALTGSSRALSFIAESGGDAFLTALRRFRGDLHATEDVLHGLELRKAEIANPADYQRLLDRIAAGEAGAYEEIALRITEAAGPPTGLPVARRPRRLQARFMRDALNKILQDKENHLLRFLIDPDKEKWLARTHLSELPTVQAGHLVSFRSGSPEALALEDSFFNQLSNWKGERFGAIFEKAAVDIGHPPIPVEVRTAVMWESLGLLPEGTVEGAMRSAGWTGIP